MLTTVKHPKIVYDKNLFSLNVILQICNSVLILTTFLECLVFAQNIKLGFFVSEVAFSFSYSQLRLLIKFTT